MITLAPPPIASMLPRTWEFSRGTLRIAKVTDRRQPLLWVQYAGYGTAELVPPMLEALEESLLFDRPVVFDDWQHVTGYDSAVRQQITDWAQADKTRILETHILVRSDLVAMGVAVANLALGGHIRAYTRRDEFEDALRAHP
jgi:hypothetical protein